MDLKWSSKYLRGSLQTSELGGLVNPPVHTQVKAVPATVQSPLMHGLLSQGPAGPKEKRHMF